VLDDDDAVRFLLERTQRRRRRTATDDTDARVLALALEQAGAYIVQRRRSLAKYLVEWRSQESRVRGWHDARVMNYPTSVAVTWQTTFDGLSSSEQALSRLLAWFAPEPIPQFVFESDQADAVAQAATRLLEPEDDSGSSVSVRQYRHSLSGGRACIVRWRAVSLCRICTPDTVSAQRGHWVDCMRPPDAGQHVE
jgi:hypothetical protein